MPLGGAAVWGQRGERDPLVAIGAATGFVRTTEAGRRPPVGAEAAFILSQVSASPDITLAELAEKLRQERGLGVALGTVWRFFERRGITFKKGRRMPPSRIGPTS